MARELEKILEWVGDNRETVNSYPRLFSTTLEYIQYLSNNIRDITSLHNTINKIQQRLTPTTAPGRAQHDNLNEFHHHFCRLADAIESDRSGRWGDLTMPKFAADYDKRKTHFETRMDWEWKTVQGLINNKELHFHRTWDILQ